MTGRVCVVHLAITSVCDYVGVVSGMDSYTPAGVYSYREHLYLISGHVVSFPDCHVILPLNRIEAVDDPCH